MRRAAFREIGLGLGGGSLGSGLGGAGKIALIAATIRNTASRTAISARASLVSLALWIPPAPATGSVTIETGQARNTRILRRSKRSLRSWVGGPSQPGTSTQLKRRHTAVNALWAGSPGASPLQRSCHPSRA